VQGGRLAYGRVFETAAAALAAAGIADTDAGTAAPA
jgi:hypothetical protein